MSVCERKDTGHRPAVLRPGRSEAIRPQRFDHLPPAPGVLRGRIDLDARHAPVRLDPDPDLERTARACGPEDDADGLGEGNVTACAARARPRIHARTGARPAPLPAARAQPLSL